jgi:ribosomal protein S18 acetylase RimI-like enzyme
MRSPPSCNRALGGLLGNRVLPSDGVGTGGGDELRRLAPNDEQGAEEAAALLSRELGEGMYDGERLLGDAADETAAVWLAGRRPLAGAAVARLLVAADAGYYASFGDQAAALFAGTVGSFEALAVEPSRRRRGLGSRLTEAALEWMWEQGCHAVVALAWRSGVADSSAGLFRRLGFREGRTVDGFYYEESVRDGWACPTCQGPCTCPATLFTLTAAG